MKKPKIILLLFAFENKESVAPPIKIQINVFF